MVVSMGQRVLLLGGSGTMGFAAFQELWKRGDEIDLVLLLREGNRRRFAPYLAEGLEVVWGDATQSDVVRRAVSGCDVVLNAMAFISPAADYHPEQAERVNVGGTKNVIEAIRAEPDGAERIRLVHTSTVGLTGDRLPPMHWGRVGDPLQPAILDFYALTKLAGERMVLESGIRHIAVLRMTFIMPTDFEAMLGLRDPIMFHMPLATHMEPVSADDAGFGLNNAVDIEPGSPFWGGVYNMGGGPGMRTTARAYQDVALRLVGLRSMAEVAERNWFATRNFHLHWYLDSDLAERYLHYQRDDLDSYVAKLQRSTPWWGKAMRTSMKGAPIRWISERATRAALRKMATRHRNGPAYWIEHDNTARIDAFFGGLDAYRSIPGWDEPAAVDPPAVPVSHGFDEAASPWTATELGDAAAFRGGSCDTSGWLGDRRTAVTWTCARQHTFRAEPNTILHAGHWCPECVAPPWRPAEEARLNPYFAQVWPYGDELGIRQEYNKADGDDIIGADQ